MSKIKIKNGDRLIPESIANGEIEDLVIVSDTEPTGKKRRKIWIKGNSTYILVNNAYTEITTDLEVPFSGVAFRLFKNGKNIILNARQLPVANLEDYVLPSKFRPSYEIMALIIYQNPGWQTLLGRATIKVDGSIVISKANSLPAVFETATDGWVSFCISYLKN